MSDRTVKAAVATAASFDAVEGKVVWSRYGSCIGSIALTASYTAPCTIPMLIWSAGGAPPANPGTWTSVVVAIRFQFVTR